MTWTDFSNPLFEDGDILTEPNIVTYIGDNLMSLPHRLAMDAADREVVSTTSELSFWSTTAGGVTVPANAMGANGSVCMWLKGDYLFNNSNGDTLTIRVKWGGSTVATPFSAALRTISASRFGWWLKIYVDNRASASAQVVSQVGFIFNTTTVQNEVATLPVTAAIDTTAAQTLDVTAQWSASSANNSWKKLWAITTLARN